VRTGSSSGVVSRLGAGEVNHDVVGGVLNLVPRERGDVFGLLPEECAGRWATKSIPYGNSPARQGNSSR
jgi:hypothetical protein